MSPGKILRPGSTKRGRVAGGEIGHRTAQTLWLHDETYWSVIWWAHKRSTSSRQILVGDIYDEALLWFLEREAKTRYDHYLATPGGKKQKRSLWVDSRLVERADGCARRDSTPRNRVLYTAFTLYTKEFAPTPTEKQIEQLKRLKSGGSGRGRPIVIARAR